MSPLTRGIETFGLVWGASPLAKSGAARSAPAARVSRATGVVAVAVAVRPGEQLSVDNYHELVHHELTGW